MPKICSIDQEYGHPILSKETAHMCLYTMHIHLGKDWCKCIIGTENLWHSYRDGSTRMIIRIFTDLGQFSGYTILFTVWSGIWQNRMVSLRRSCGEGMRGRRCSHFSWVMIVCLFRLRCRQDNLPADIWMHMNSGDWRSMMNDASLYCAADCVFPCFGRWCAQRRISRTATRSKEWTLL